MGITSISSNLTRVSSGAGSKINVGYKVQPTAEESSRTANCDTYENSEIAEKVKSQIKDRIANLKVPSLFDVQGKPSVNGRSDLQSSYRTVVGRDGSTFKLLYTSNCKTGEKYSNGYFDILAEKAAGINNPDYFEYFTNMKSDIVAAFSTAATYTDDMAAVQSAIFSVIDEMKDNIANGMENPTENLKTTVTIGGVEWGIKDILETSALIRNSFDGVDRTITMDYIEYAKMGLSAGNVQNYADNNLNKEQAEAVKSLLTAKLDYYTNRSDKAAPEVLKKWENYGIKHNTVDAYKTQFYKYGYVVSATNEDLRSSIKNIFSSVGKDRNLAEALSMYEKLMTPALKASGVAEKDFSEVLKNHTKTLSSYYSALSLLQK